jgi:hypothetical protein
MVRRWLMIVCVASALAAVTSVVSANAGSLQGGQTVFTAAQTLDKGVLPVATAYARAAFVQFDCTHAAALSTSDWANVFAR